MSVPPSEQERYVAGSRFSGLDAATGLVLGLGSSILTARVFGATVVGQFALAALLTGTFGLISNLREQGGLVRELTRHQAGSPESRALLLATLAFSALLTAALLAPFVGLSILLLRGPLDHPELVAPFLVMSGAYLVVDNTAFNLNAPLAAYRDGRSVWLARTGIAVTFIAGLLACAALGIDDVWGLIAASIASSLAGLVIRAYAVGRLTGLRTTPRDLRRAAGRLKVILSFGIRQAPTNYSETAIEYADSFILGLTVPLAGLGAYNRAYGLYKRMSSIPVQVSGLYFPTLCALHVRGQHDAMARVYRLTGRYLILLMLPAAAWLAISAPAVMAVFGPGFEPAAPALAILGFVVVVDVYGRLAGGVGAAADRPGRISLITMGGATVNVALCAALIPPLELPGAALANLGGFLVTTLLSARLAARLLGQSFAYMFEPRFLVRLVAAAALMALVLWPLRGLPLALLWLTLAAPPVLAGALLATRPLEHRDEDTVRRALGAAGVRSERLLGLALAAHRRLAHGPREAIAS